MENLPCFLFYLNVTKCVTEDMFVILHYTVVATSYKIWPIGDLFSINTYIFRTKLVGERLQGSQTMVVVLFICQ